MASVQDSKSVAEPHLSSSAHLRDTSAGSSSTSSPSETRFLLQRIERLEAELAAAKDAGGHKTDVDVGMDREAHVRRLPPGALPVRAWFRGAVPVNSRCHMLWNDNNSKLTVSFSDAAAGVAAHALELDLREVVSVNYTDADDTRNHPVVAFRTAQMQITLSLEACDAEWSATRYRELVGWIQAQLGENDGVVVFCCRYAVTQNIWETVAKVVNEDEHAPAAPKQLVVNAADPESAQNLFRATFGPKSHLQLEPETKHLPVKAWYSRGRLSQAAEACIVWPVSARACIVLGAGNDLAGHVEELDIGTAAKCAWFVDPKENCLDKVLVLQTAELEPAGGGGESRTLIKFDGASARWSDSAYEAFVSWIKGKVDQYAVIRGKIGDAKWEAATKPFALMGTDARVALPGEQTRALNTERLGTPQRMPVGGEALVQLEEAHPHASNNAKPEARRRMPVAEETRVELESSDDEHRVNKVRRGMQKANITGDVAQDSRPRPSYEIFRDNLDIGDDVELASLKELQPGEIVRPNFKKSMKPKHPTSKPPNKNPFLPIKAWFLGRKLFDCQKLFDEPYHLIWTAGKMTIRSGADPNVQAQHSEEIDMAWFAKGVWFVEPNEPYPDKVFVLETYKMSNNKKAGTQKPFGTQFSEFFELGSKYAEGHIVIKFDSTSPVWADPAYAQFVDWLKAKVDSREILRGKAGDAKWDAMMRIDLATKAAEARLRRENGGSAPPARRNAKSAPVTEMPRLDSPPTSAITANRKAPTKRKSYPIDSPSLYRGEVASFRDHSRFSDTLNNRRGSNLSARGNVVAYTHTTRTGPPPHKRARVDSSASRTKKKGAQSSNSSLRLPRLGDPDDTGIIYVDDEYTM